MSDLCDGEDSSWRSRGGDNSVLTTTRFEDEVEVHGAVVDLRQN